ncbi:FecCD family ABC transporter permease [Burkholderia singularis]|uniref:Iron(III) dicitrate transport system permease protein FecD (TC 3.A.1.14.1) n=1 Tax=Burkholderia singularis TaxID=1503053 RepID=A0A238HCJ1_9BURK|nr:iron ABC transporter permease [Burkholderia singularis]SMG02713.1 Iron(III) dicitrate transport system permease protein FecD (TC 3.A.1.14.1) [Burkholderia singularis]
MSALPASPPSLRTRYRAVIVRRIVALVLLTGLLAALVIVDIATGPSTLTPADIVAGLLNPDSLPLEQRVILWSVRIPYALMAVLVGAALGLAGAEMQTMLNNPLASPFTLGLSAAASVGASVAVLANWHWPVWNENLAVPLGAFVTATGATLLIVWLAWRHGATTETVVLFGIGLMFSFEALLWLLQFIADSNALEQIVFWSMGSLAHTSWSKIAILAVVLAGCALWASGHVWSMTALRAGEEQARSMGIAVERLRLTTLVRISFLSATALSFVGTIGFVGLVGPHIARLLVGDDHRYYLPGGMLAGALMMAGASILSKTLVSGIVLPIGIITALVGVPLFMTLISRRKRHD